MFNKGGFVYILTSNNHNVIYTGVTSNLYKRVYEHRNNHYPSSFTSRYNCKKLVYYNAYDTIADAIREEKRIKGGNRRKKIMLIETMNPEWKDLWDTIDL